MKKILLLITDLFFLTRPIIVVPVWGFSAFGVYCVSKSLLIHLDAKQYILILLYSLAPAAVYVINQIADYEVDKTNEGFPLLVRGNIPMKAAWICAVLCGLISTVGPLLMGHAAIALLSLTAITVGCIYSCKPFSLSGRPFTDFLTNGFEAFLAFAAGWCAVGGELADISLYKQALPYFLLMCAGSISSTLPDIRGDRAHGKITTAVRFGPISAHRIALAALLAAIPASLFISGDYLALTCAVLVIPVYIPYLISAKSTDNSLSGDTFGRCPNAVKCNPAYVELPHKAGGAITMLAAAIITPLLLPAGIIIYFMTWFYFRKRHNISYPSLTPSAADV